MNATWIMDQTKLLTRSEIAAVLADLKRKSKRSINTQMNLVIFRLATCCGLRVSEISQLQMKHVKLSSQRPHISLPKSITKRAKARRVPLWWDSGTLADITEWKRFRESQGASGEDLFVISQGANLGKPLSRQKLYYRFKSACKVLDKAQPGRTELLTIHHGRHSFCSHALAGGRTLAEVRDAAGHSNISTTSVYAHIAVDDDDVVGDIFKY